MRPRSLAFLLIALAACNRAEVPEAASDEASIVEILSATEEPFAVTIEAMGVIAPRSDGIAALAAPGLSRVTAIRVGIGDAVERGQLLVSLDPSVWDAQLADAEASVESARQAKERADRLADQGILPRKEAETAAADLARAQAALAAASRTRSLADLRSPIRGVVESLDAALDQMAAEGEILVRVVDTRTLEIVFQVSPAQAGLVRPGMNVRAGRGADSDDWPATGRVVAVSSRIDSGSGGVQVRASMQSASQPLRIGENVTGRIELELHEHAIVVPATAIVETAGQTGMLFVVGSDGLAHARSVTIGARSGDRVEIVKGLTAGESIVGVGAYAVSDSSRVRAESGS